MTMDYSSDVFDIIIQGGQSNSDGTGFGDASVPYVPKETVLYMTGDKRIAVAAERQWDGYIAGDFSLSFADLYINTGMLQPGKKLLILRGAVGGTGFLDHRWRKEDDLYEQLMSMVKSAQSLNPRNKPVVFLWHQGETDATLNASYDTHTQNLSSLLNDVRSISENPALPFIAGDFVRQWKNDNAAICEPVVAAIREVCADDKYSGFVETDGLQSNDQRFGNGDTIHFCREALYELGKRYYAKYSEIVNRSTTDRL